MRYEEKFLPGILLQHCNLGRRLYGQYIYLTPTGDSYRRVVQHEILFLHFLEERAGLNLSRCLRQTKNEQRTAARCGRYRALLHSIFPVRPVAVGMPSSLSNTRRR